jgi:hypothetical protein
LAIATLKEGHATRGTSGQFDPLAQEHIVVGVYACQQKRGHPQPFSRPLHKARAPTHGYEPTREAAMSQKLAAGVKIASVAARQHRDGDESDIQ